ncbi:Fic family protein [Bathymodiolus septemdierum thioautotrophic gill symbiont]|uniref:Filamentation induced by cAMP protein Fic-like C-terminal domain-containing protein n=1 Tax=endosymbiont of Bathymodiolus septemdierum str. Myojin knoll TaxID=1303921 RepID=A0A0P0URI8_9GAMM|nr:hypothetical protein [Bathymodiolus septemdierum thioautotrophic gill symbiont]BAS67859.1 conserved hypothetical protein [endosymbiont of Bathymodiolus septemdierum str. Myojin knoll]
MGLFNRNKSKENIEIFDDDIRDLKRNIVNKTGKEQPNLFNDENIDINIHTEELGTKKGLSNFFTKLKKNHIDILKGCVADKSAAELIKILKRTNKSKFKNDILNPLIEAGFLELTIPEKPKSPKQKYRPTGKFVARISKN